jgi:WD40 repeat protein
MNTPADLPPSDRTGEFPRARIRRSFGEPRFHTDSALAALVYAADGLLWSMEEGGWLRCWASDGRQLRQLLLSDLETLWQFSSDATALASASDEVTLWDPTDGTQIATIDQPSWVTALVFNPKGSILATGHDDGSVRLWNTQSQELVAELSQHSMPISAMAFSSDGAFLAVACEDRTIQIIDAAKNNVVRTLTGHTDRIPAVAWHPDGSMLASAGWDTTARLWDIKTGDPVILLNSHADQVVTLAFSPDGSLLAVADSDNVIHVWDDPRSGRTLHVLQGHNDEIRYLTFSHDGKRLASAGNDLSIHVWDPIQGRLLAGQNTQSRYAISVGDGTTAKLASSCGGTGFEVYDLAAGKPIPPTGTSVPHIMARQEEPEDLSQRKIAPLVASGLAVSPNGRWLVAGSDDSYLHAWDLNNVAAPIQLRGSWGPVGAIAFAQDSNLFAAACADDGTCWIWDLAKREPYLLMPEAADGCSVEAVAFHPNGRWVACGGIDWLSTRGTDGAICLWDIVDRKRLFIFEGGVSGLAFHPNGRWLAGASLADESIVIWDVTEEGSPNRLNGHQERVRAVAFHPSGRWLASAGDDRTLRLWNGTTFEPEQTWQFDTPIKGLAFSPDGKSLFIANANTTCSELEWAALVDEET